MAVCNTSSCSIKSKTVKQVCPVCNQLCLDVPKSTILQHLKQAWLRDLCDEQYFFCRTSDCDVVYFSNTNYIFKKIDVRTSIGIKEQDDTALICYCFGVNKAVAAKNKKAKDFIVAQTKNSTCSCETTNPSGRCCLKDFPKFR